MRSKEIKHRQKDKRRKKKKKKKGKKKKKKKKRTDANYDDDGRKTNVCAREKNLYMYI